MSILNVAICFWWDAMQINQVHMPYETGLVNVSATSKSVSIWFHTTDLFVMWFFIWWNRGVICFGYFGWVSTRCDLHRYRAVYFDGCGRNNDFSLQWCSVYRFIHEYTKPIHIFHAIIERNVFRFVWRECQNCFKVLFPKYRRSVVVENVSARRSSWEST